jgi:H+/Cl- antiporter ClcA
LEVVALQVCYCVAIIFLLFTGGAILSVGGGASQPLSTSSSSIMNMLSQQQASKLSLFISFLNTIVFSVSTQAGASGTSTS